MTGRADVLTLHGYFRSSASYRVRIALNLKGLEHAQFTHHLRRGDQRSAAYLALNPQGLVPALTWDEAVLTQSLAIVEYLEEAYPEPALLPVDPLDRARVRALAQIVACDIHPLNNLRVLEYLRRDACMTEAAVRQWYGHWVHEGFSAFEALLASDRRTGEFCHGASPTLADVCLVPQVANARNFLIDLSAYPLLAAIADRAARQEAFVRAHPTAQPDAE